jgi:hypothetical protein
LFTDQHEVFAEADKGTLKMADIFLVPFEDSQNRQVLYFHTTGNITSDPGYTRGYTYYMDYEMDDFNIGANYYDTVCRGDGPVDNYSPRLDIEVDSYCPDEAEFFIKKFRTVMFEMESAQFNLELKYSFGDWNQYTAPIPMVMSAPKFADPTRPPYPFRYPINQRGRSITFKITAGRTLLAYADMDHPTKFQIERMILTWSPTVRAPVGVASGAIE